MKSLCAILSRIILTSAIVLPGHPASAFVVTISAGARSLYLQVGLGCMAGGNGTFSGGATPCVNTTVNKVSLAVPASSIGAGSQAMATDSTQIVSPWNNRSFCAVPAQVYVGGFYRQPGTAGNATLSATSPVSLTNAAGGTIPFSQISWISGGLGDAPATIPSGTFVGGTTQSLLSITANTWFESCLQFNFANSGLAPAGTFTGRVSYNLSAP